MDLAAIDLRDTVRGVINSITKEFKIKGDLENVNLTEIKEDDLKGMIGRLIPYL